MQRRQLFFAIVIMQFFILGIGLFIMGATPAGATGKPMPIIPVSTQAATIAVGPSVTAQSSPVTTQVPGTPVASTTSQLPPNPVATTVPVITTCQFSFSDVQQNDYFYEPVRSLYCARAISGYGDNTFRPYSPTTRGQMVKIIVLARKLALVTPSQPSFSDVPSTNPFYSFIETAAAKGFVSGYSDGSFRWYNNVTRGQLAKIIVTAAGWSMFNPSVATFSDVAPSNAFYKYIETASAHGLLTGYNTANGLQFRWSDNATRGQIAKIVYLAQSK